MRCNHCNNPMHKTDEVIELHARQTWYECPVCSGVHTVSERVGDNTGQRIGNSQRFSAVGDPSAY